MKPVKLLIFTVLISSFIFLAAASAETIVGELPGEFTVNNLGAASYTVPLTVSPGTAGVEPKLSISYSSRGDNGLLGLGFSLGGLSTISRGGASLDQDGFIDGVDFDDNDRFLLDGKRLEIVALNGSPTTNKAFYGDANTEYRTEIDSFSRVEAFGQAGNGPAWFRVWTKSGLIYEYGNTTDSVFKPGSHISVLSWAVNKISDTAGNYMTFTYTQASSGPRISRIDYTGNTNAALATYNSVEFVYENRPDETLSFFKGVKMEQTKRLSKIVMKHDGSYLYDYRLSYTVNEAGQSTVESLQQFFGEGAGADCLPENRFEFSGVSGGGNFSFTSGSDLLPADLGFYAYSSSDMDGYSESDQEQVLNGDFNGDGLSDLCSMGSSSSHRWVGLSNGDGTFEFTSGTDLLPAGLGFDVHSSIDPYASSGGYQDQVLTGDFDGDGLTDLCAMGSSSTHRWVGLSNGDGTFEFTSGSDLLPANLGFVSYLSSDPYAPSGSRQDRFLSADFNGDGLTDICAMGSYNRWVGLSNGDGTFEFTSGTNLLDAGLGFSAYSSSDPYAPSGGYQDRLLSADFNGDGLADLCAMGSYNRWLGLSNGDGTFEFTSGTNLLDVGLGFAAYSSSDPYAPSGGYQDQLLSTDFNGDGLSDLCAMGSYNRWLGLSNGDGTFTFTSGSDLLSTNLGFASYSSSDPYLPSGSHQDRLLSSDFNGDGLNDLCAMGSYNRWVGLSCGDGTFTFTSGSDLLPTNLGFTSYSSSDPYASSGGYQDRLLSADFNGDGLSDLCAMATESTHRWVGLSSGDGTFEFTSGTDVLDVGLGFDAYSNSDPYDSSESYQDHILTADFNGDGLPDLLAMGSYNRWVGLNGNEVSRMKKVTQGYQSVSQHGVVTEVDYLPITDADIYIKGSGAEYPIRDIISPMHVVSRMTKDNGQDGEYRTDYAYRSARYHAHGRGFLGFQQFISYDYETDICYAETLAHEFPLTGRPTRTETFYIPDPEGDPEDPEYKQLIKLVENEWTYDLVDGGTLFALNPKSTETKWELGNTNTPISVVSTWNWFDEQDTTQLPRMGNPTTFYSEIVYGDLSQNVIDYGGGLEQTTENSYSNLVDSTHWLLGRLQASGVRHQASGQSDIVRSSSFDYYVVSGLLSQETIEPGNPDFELITDCFYDDFGNIVRKELSGADISNRVVQYSDYDAKGRFVEETQNALGHETTFVFDQALGRPLSSTDPNGLTTEWEYDQTGRLIYEERPDGTVTTNEYSWDFSTTVSVPAGPGSGSSISQKAAYKLHTETDGAPPVTTWFDKQGREIRTQTKSADGRDVFVLKGYNSIAQPIAVSEPYFSGDTPVYTFTEYDGLGRAQYVTAPDGTVSEQVYEGLTTKAIKDSDHRTAGAKHQVHTTVKNAKGEVLNVTDAMSNTVTFVYDPVGNLIQTTDPATNVTQMGYDVRGNKISQDDPDMGEWTYEYNALDQLISQTDANGNIIQTSYDVLDRATARTNYVNHPVNGLELESTASWSYDGSTEGDRLGMLRLEECRAGTGSLINRKRYAYDEYSRPMLELMNYDQKWYYTALEYDAFSRVEKVHRYWRPKGKEGIDSNLDPQWNTFVSINTYNNYGALLEVSDGESHTWWETSESDYDAYGRLAQYQYGNGLITTNTFNPLTGRTTDIGISDFQSQISNFQFQYDRLGNLTQRAQSRPLMTTLTETCTYDSLNRLLTTSTASTNSTVVYDALGNLTSRTGVGSYLYGTKPHAVSSVTSVSSVVDYSYDANGNIVRRNRDSQQEFTADWTSFNKPKNLIADDNESEFEYSVDGRRTRQLIIDGSNIVKKVYATPAYEMREVLSNPAETNRANWVWEMEHCRIYVDTPAGKIGVYQQEGFTNGVGTVSRSYMHKDHLGSIVAISDDATNVTFMSFDAWGNRRDPDDWSSAENPELLAPAETDRGFTGHEMLDHVQLIHMNGRVFDGTIGRFLSPDPLIQAPENLQSYNRYSYVWNNPLTRTDPSGFATPETAQKGAAKGGKDLVEQISSQNISENDSTGTQSENQSGSTETTYEDVYNDNGDVVDSISNTRNISGSNTEEKFNAESGHGAGANNDGPRYGVGTGGGPGSGSKLDPANSDKSPFAPTAVSFDSGPPSVRGVVQGIIDTVTGFGEKLHEKSGLGSAGRWVNKNIPGVKKTGDFLKRPEVQMGLMLAVGSSPKVGPKSPAYRYVSKGEAAAARQSGRVPNVTRTGDPKNVHYSGERFTGASSAEKALRIGSQNPHGATASPTHRITVESAGANWNTGGNVAGGAGTELITTKELPVFSIDSLIR